MKLLSFIISMVLAGLTTLVYFAINDNHILVANRFFDFHTTAGSLGLLFAGLGFLTAIFILLALGLTVGSANVNLTKKSEEYKIKYENQTEKVQSLEATIAELKEKNNSLEEKLFQKDEKTTDI